MLMQPETVKDMKKFSQLNKEYKDLEPIVQAYERYKKLLSNIDYNRQILSTEKDEEMRDMARSELDRLGLQSESAARLSAHRPLVTEFAWH